MTKYDNPDLMDIMYDLNALIANIKTAHDDAERGVNTSHWFDETDSYKRRFEHALQYLADASDNLAHIKDLALRILDDADDIAEGETYAAITQQATRDRG